ncbi:MAG TPA: hypothetical protein VHW46_17590 [Terracidiphilus sp.]|nr:hypothetical protein [Terracidiphilus sp.]
MDDAIRSDLQSSSDFFFWLALLSSAIVVVGVALEGPELLHELWPNKFSIFATRWVKTVGLVGWLLVLGVGGEVSFGLLENKAQGLSQTFNEILLADAQRQSSDANERAGGAYERAAETEGEASQENERAARAEHQASEENARAAQALKAAEVARNNAEGFSLQIAQANGRAASANEIAERERFARLQLEARLADRVITPDQQHRITEAFASMKGQTVDVVLIGDSLETNKTANAIIEAIHGAGVLLNFFHPFGGGNAEGVLVAIRADAPDEVRQAGNRLIAILRETLDGGVGQYDFEKTAVNGTGSMGSEKGATPSGKAPLRLQIAPK